MDEKEKQEEIERHNQARQREAMKYYAKEQEFLQHQARTGFGKMILAEKPTAPKYSIGKAKRQPLYSSSNTPGPIYSLRAGLNMKYDRPPEWKIGDSKRSPLYSNEIFEYYKHDYDENSDLSKIPKKWNHIIGGAASLEPRIKYDFSEKVPGPGRYDANYSAKSQAYRAPTYPLQFKTKFNSLDLSTGTGRNVGPNSYNQDNLNALSQHSKFPVYSFNKEKRQGMANKIWTKNESYFLYSSIGTQIMTQKPTEPIQSLPKSTRDGRLKQGMFKSMMERQPQKIRIQMPKF
jgi:hypothetical protein